MLQITIPGIEMFDDSTEEFVSTKERTLQLEHSLISLSKWESKWHKPFLEKNTQESLTAEENLDYVRCMTLTQNVEPEVYHRLTRSNLQEIHDYIDNTMTATVFPKDNSHGNKGEFITSELIYYWMTALQIPFVCEKWHLNRLLTLIRICNIKNQPEKKMGRQETLKRNSAINAARRKKYNTKG